MSYVKRGLDGWFDVKEFGAKGDGTTDDYAAIMRAYAAAGTGGTIYFPSGSYRTSETIVVNKPHRFYGSITVGSATNTRIMPDSGKSGFFVVSGGQFAEFAYFELKGTRLTAGGTGLSGTLPVWSGSASYASGTFVQAPNENRYYYACVVSGTSAPRLSYQPPVSASLDYFNASFTSVTKSNASSADITVSPQDAAADYNMALQIMTTGWQGTASFQYSSNGGSTWSSTQTTAAAAYQTLGSTRIKVYTSGNYISGTTYTFTTTKQYSPFQAYFSSYGAYLPYSQVGGHPMGVEYPTDSGNYINYYFTDNDITWEPRIHAGFVCRRSAHIHDVYVWNFTNSAVHVQAAGSTVEWRDEQNTNANQMRVERLYNLWTGVGIFVRGDNANTGVYNDINITGPGYFYPGLGGHGIWNHSFLGTVFRSSQVASGTGRGLLATSTAASGNIFDECYSESFTNYTDWNGDGTSGNIAVGPCVVIAGAHGPGWQRTGNGVWETTSAAFVAAPGGGGYKTIKITDYASTLSLEMLVDRQDGYSAYSFRNDDDGSSQYWGFRYGYSGLSSGFWGLGYGNSNAQYPFTFTNPASISGSFDGADNIGTRYIQARPGVGFIQFPYGHFQGLTSNTAAMFEGTDYSLKHQAVRWARRLPGDGFTRDAAIYSSHGRWAKRTIIGTGYRGYTWTASTSMSAGNLTYGTGGSHIEPTTNTDSPSGGEKVFRCISGGITSGSEPTWSSATVVGDRITDGTATWEYVGTTPAYGYSGKIEHPSYEQTPQAASTWADTSDTGTVVPYAQGRCRRRTARTTTSGSTVIDDGGSYSSVDLTLPNNAITNVEVTVVAKLNGSTDAGLFKMSGAWYRDAGGNATAVGSVDYMTPKLTNSLTGMSCSLIANGTKVEVQAYVPSGSMTLDYSIFRAQYEGLAQS
jgi:hypothetical protein